MIFFIVWESGFKVIVINESTVVKKEKWKYGVPWTWMVHG
jgi:hypothetical protein